MKKTKKTATSEAPVIKRSHKKKEPVLSEKMFESSVESLVKSPIEVVLNVKRSHKKKTPAAGVIKKSNIDGQGGITKELDKNLVIIDLYQRLVAKQKELIELFQA